MTKRELTPEEQEKLRAGFDEMAKHFADAAGVFSAGLRAFGEAFTEVAKSAQERKRVEEAAKAEPEADIDVNPTPGSTIYVVGHVGSRAAYVERLEQTFPERPIIWCTPLDVEGQRYAPGDLVFIVDALARQELYAAQIGNAVRRNRAKCGDPIIRLYSVLDLRGLETVIDELTS